MRDGTAARQSGGQSARAVQLSISSISRAIAASFRRPTRLTLAEGAPAHLASELTRAFRDELETQRLPAMSMVSGPAR